MNNLINSFGKLSHNDNSPYELYSNEFWQYCQNDYNGHFRRCVYNTINDRYLDSSFFLTVNIIFLTSEELKYLFNKRIELISLELMDILLSILSTINNRKKIEMCLIYFLEMGVDPNLLEKSSKELIKSNENIYPTFVNYGFTY